MKKKETSDNKTIQHYQADTTAVQLPKAIDTTYTYIPSRFCHNNAATKPTSAATAPAETKTP